MKKTLFMIILIILVGGIAYVSLTDIAPEQKPVSKKIEHEALQ